MAAAGLVIDFAGLVRQAARIDQLRKGGLDRVRTRTVATLKRRLGPEAARLLSAEVLNLTPRQISPHLSVEVSGSGLGVDALILRGDRGRLPLSDFRATWGGRNTPGAVATLWRDAGPITFAHTFKVKGGGKQIWQRVPFTGAKFNSARGGRQRGGGSASGLVDRLPIVVRKGPAFARAVTGKKHGDILPPLFDFARSVLADEVARLLKVELR